MDVHAKPRAGSRDLAIGAAALGAVALIILALRSLQTLPNATISALLLLLVILVTATAVRLAMAVMVSVLSTLAFNFFLLPPFHTFTLADPQNWVVLLVFLLVAIIADQLSRAVQDSAREAMARRDELARLFDLSRDVLVMTASPDAVSHLARSVARRFDLEFVAVALPAGSGWSISHTAGASARLDERQLTEAFAAAAKSLEFDAYARTYAGHRSIDADGRTIRLVPLRVGTKPIGLLAASGRPVEPGTLDALAGLVAIAIERMQFLEERKDAELTRRSEELKTALLASLGHDLRTPLTAIRVAAGNLTAAWLTGPERDEQSDIIVTEVERLTRLFHNVLEMARIDAGAIEKHPQWTHPSEIVAAAREQVEHALKGHPVTVTAEPDVTVQLDARLTASALAQVLENAAQYAPAGTPIEVTATITAAGLTIHVRDDGPGISPVDLPHVFDRFYRGAASRTRAAGSGMGLWIARGLLAAAQGQLWAENRPEGGARFTLSVPAAAAQPAREVTSP